MNKNINSKELRNHYLVEVPLNTIDVGQRYLIGDIQQLRNVKIIAIQTQSSSTFQNTITGRTVLSPASMANFSLSLTLVNHNENQQEGLLNVPFTSLMRFRGNLTYTDNLEIDLSKSYVTLHDITGIVAGYSCLISVYYEKR